MLNASGSGMSAGGPWGTLPMAPAPWAGGSQWQAAQQSPWRMSPWQTQGMPSGMEVAPPPALPAGGLLNAGQSSGLPGFNPAIPGGGFYPWIGGQQQQQQQAAPLAGGMSGWTSGGQMYDTLAGANAATRQHNQMVADSPMPNEMVSTRPAGFMGGMIPTNVGRGTANPNPTAQQIRQARSQAAQARRGQPRFGF